MAYYGNVFALPKDAERYTSNCVNGSCSGCGECCTDLLPLSESELLRLRDYARAHGLKEHRQAPFFDRGAVDLTCPFRNEHTRKCEVYEVRPKICREFICSKSKEQARRDRDDYHRTHRTYSLRNEVFGNPECVDFLRGMALKLTQKRSE